MTTERGRGRRQAGRHAVRPSDLLPLVAAAAILVGEAGGAFGDAASAALAVGIAVMVATVRPVILIFRMAAQAPAVQAHAPVAQGPAAATPSQLSATALTLTRAFALLAGGLAVAAASAVGAGLADLTAPHLMVSDVPLPVEIPNVGLFFTAGLCLGGLLLLPGTALTAMARTRRILDGVSVGLCAFFVAWVLVISTFGWRGAAVTVSLLGSLSLGAATIAGLRAARHDWVRVAAGVGVLASVLGQTCLTIAMDFSLSRAWVLGCGALLVVGPVLVQLGLTAIVRNPYRPTPADDDGSFAGYPLLAGPVAGAVLAAAYHFIQKRTFDGTSITLGIIGVSLVAVRETLAAIDVRRLAVRLAGQRSHFRSLFAGSSEVTLVLDDDFIVRWQSPAAARLLGLSDQDVVGRSLLSLLHVDDAKSVMERLVTFVMSGGIDDLVIDDAQLHDGFDGWREIELRMSDQRGNDAVGALVAHIRDVGDRRTLERSLRRADFADQLTTLPNRRELRRALAERANPGVVMVLCLDGIAGVNDMHGRAVGDAVLVEAARRLRESVAEGDLPARLDGDKFAVVTDSGAIHAQLLATRLLTAVTEPYAMPATTAYVSGRIGLAELERGETGGVDADETLRRAELALRKAKRPGRSGGVEWHDESMERVVRRQLAIEQKLPGAIGRGELELRFQPIVDLMGLSPVGAEAVLSWRHPAIGTLTAEELLPLATELGHGGEISEWMLHRVCRQLSAWRRDGHELWIAVDVAAEQLAGPELAGMISAALQTHQVPASSLMIEFPEGGLDPTEDAGGAGRRGSADPSADARAQAIVGSLAELRALGVKVAVDHFGTATTSLRRLRLLPVDLLKVDRQLFTEPVDGGGAATAIIDVMVKFGRQLGVEVAAQGLEDEADVERVKAAGCRYGQGTPFSRAVPAEYLEAYLDNHRAHRF